MWTPKQREEGSENHVQGRIANLKRKCHIKQDEIYLIHGLIGSSVSKLSRSISCEQEKGDFAARCFNHSRQEVGNCCTRCSDDDRRRSTRQYRRARNRKRGIKLLCAKTIVLYIQVLCHPSYDYVAQWIRRRSTKPKIPGSIPGMVICRNNAFLPFQSSVKLAFLLFRIPGQRMPKNARRYKAQAGRLAA